MKLFSLVILVGIAGVIGTIRLSSPAHCHSNDEGTWSIGMLEGPHWSNMSAPRDLLSLPDGQQVSCPRNPIMACADVTDVNASFTADPFLFFPNGTDGAWYAFFEVKNMNDDRSLRLKRGQIGAAVSHDQGVTWTYLQIVLRTHHHLSYPHVVHYKGEIYMLPQGGAFSLYKCVKFPTEWKLKKYLLKRHNSIVDASTVYFQDRWWAIGIKEGQGKMFWKLHVYYADKLTGPWQSTPNNCYTTNSKGEFTCVGKNVTEPHKSGNKGVRPGGRMFVDNGKLYRVVQHSGRMYGDGLDLYEVTSLTVDGKMKETVVPSFRQSLRHQSNVDDWNRIRFHHADLHKVPGMDGLPDRWVMLVDGDSHKGPNSRSVIRRDFKEARCSDVRRAHGI